MAVIEGLTGEPTTYRFHEHGAAVSPRTAFARMHAWEDTRAREELGHLMMRNTYTRLLVSLALSLLGLDYSFAIDATSYFPLESGITRTYQEDAGAVFTETVLPGTVVVNGVATKAVELSDGTKG